MDNRVDQIGRIQDSKSTISRYLSITSEVQQPISGHQDDFSRLTTPADLVCANDRLHNPVQSTLQVVNVPSDGAGVHLNRIVFNPRLFLRSDKNSPLLLWWTVEYHVSASDDARRSKWVHKPRAHFCKDSPHVQGRYRASEACPRSCQNPVGNWSWTCQSCETCSIPR